MRRQTTTVDDAPGSKAQETNSREQAVAAILSRRAQAEFLNRGGRLAAISAVEIQDIVFAVLACISAEGWRVHKDQPVCHVCRADVDRRAAEYRQWAATEGTALANRMAEQNAIDTEAYLREEAAKGH